MLVTNGVAAFQLSSSIFGHDSTIFPSFIWDEESAILIDTGYPSHSSIIIQEIIKKIDSLNRLKAIIITHQDIDHIGVCVDFDLAKKSLKVLLDYDICQIICYHGGMVTKNVRQQLSNLC